MEECFQSHDFSSSKLQLLENECHVTFHVSLNTLVVFFFSSFLLWIPMSHYTVTGR